MKLRLGVPFLCLTLSAASVPFARAVQAQSREPRNTTEDTVRLAEALFDEAKLAMDRQDFAVACAKFEESRRLDPAGGTQLALAVCYERAGRMASAWYAFREALAAAQRDGRSDREVIAQSHLAELEPKLSRVTVIVPPEVAALPQIRVDLGDTELRQPSWGVAVPFDPGSYALRVSAAGYQSFTGSVTLEVTADHQQIEVPMLVEVPHEEPRKVTPRTPVAYPRDAGASVNQKLGYVFAGASAAALIPGIYFGGRAIAVAQTVNDECRGNTCPYSVRNDHAAASSDALRANALIGAGVVAAGVSLYFFLTAKPARTKPSITAQVPSLSWEFQ